MAQEKSTISTDAALVTFRVRRYVSAAVPKVYGISRLTSFSAWLWVSATMLWLASM